MPDLPKIYILCQGIDEHTGDHVGFALAQDGTGLVLHVSSSKIWLRRDMGLKSDNYAGTYHKHYPAGYQLVDYIDATDAELEADSGFATAYQINNKQDQPQGDDK